MGVATEMLPKLPDLNVEQAEHWVAAVLAEERALRQHDAQLFPSADEPASLRVAESLHAAWREWADSADAVYDRLRPLLAARRHIVGASDLHHAIGRARAMLQITPENNLEAIEQVRRGDVVSAEEVRRELRARVQ